jgi:2-polyprenyl-3-methyl-5-hydroxy-6-metoxy-1,4-benzoquinol methylase
MLKYKLISRRFKSLMQGLMNLSLIHRLCSKSLMPSFIMTLLSSEGRKAILKDADTIVGTINQTGFKDIYNHYKDADPYPGSSKYLDASTHVARAVNNIHKLALNQKQGLSLLDIGSGPGYFPFSCQHFGHKAAALDINDNLMYNKLKKLLNVDCTFHRIEAFQPLPAFSDRFDYITAFQILFDRYPDKTPWQAQEWDFFMNDLKKHTHPQASVFFELNTFNAEETPYLESVLRYFKQGGAQITDQRIFIENLSRFSSKA